MRYAILLPLSMAVIFFTGQSNGQSVQIQVTPAKDQKPKQLPDEFRSILSAIEEAYKAPREVDEDVLDELRKQYRNPSPEREAKIFYEIRRLYVMTPEREDAILREIRKSYEQQTPEQEARIFREIRKGGTLPLGTVSLKLQNDEAAKLFRRLDLDRNGSLIPDEMTDALRQLRGQWDRDRDGVISLDEFSEYYRGSLNAIAEKVASGEISLKAARQTPGPEMEPAKVPESRPAVARQGKLPPGLPDWFTELDQEGDKDGQIGLYEWKKSQKPISEFIAMDLNGDGLLTVEEYLTWKARQEAKKTDRE